MRQLPFPIFSGATFNEPVVHALEMRVEELPFPIFSGATFNINEFFQMIF
ncbi:hypothetical protein B0H22_10911 [Methanohalophilus euhalobius]|uniref:Uncharacterized protein n=1 Tax=Methanohalophilus euhalobius TaxID=51203 RepID=A0A314ZUG0_9EURY|nr:hypothetical protein B0H22_10911 [Methanohalophilus euhalobius]